MRKKVFSTVIVVLALAVMFTACGTNTKDFKYRKDASGVFIVEYTGKKTKVNIPEKIDGIPVASIGDNAFRRQPNQPNPTGDKSLDKKNAYRYRQLTKVTIPASVQIIGNGAFVGNKLTKVEVSESALVYEYAFDANTEIVRK